MYGAAGGAPVRPRHCGHFRAADAKSGGFLPAGRSPTYRCPRRAGRHITEASRMATANDIRTTFLDYFAKHGHEPVASSPLVPRNDPTLMFTNAGMVQFKNVFTGAEQRPSRRPATSQQSVPAGGTPNDPATDGSRAPPPPPLP